MLNTINYSAYWRLARMDKPIGTYLLMWPTLMALWHANAGLPSIELLIIFTVGVVLMRSAGDAINDYFDRDFDKHVARTQSRPLATGELMPKQALSFFCMLGLLSFGLALQLNTFALMLSIFFMGLTILYPLMKRFTYMPQFFLGVVWSSSILIAYAAQTDELPSVAFVLFAANICLTIAYDTMYAMVDRDDDLNIGVKSTAILFGNYDRLWIGFFHTLTMLCWVSAGIMLELSWIYYSGCLCALGFMIYQHYLIKQRDPKRCFQAFLNHHYLLFVVFSTTVLDYYL